MLDTILSPVDFYRQTMAANGVTPADMDLVKIAEVEKRPIEVVKLARSFYDQSQLDGIAFEDAGARKEAAYQMAEMFFAQLAEGQAEATKVADGLVRFLKHAAEGYLAQNQLELTPEEAIKIAGLQVTEPCEPEKVAAFTPPSAVHVQPTAAGATATSHSATIDIPGMATHFRGGVAPSNHQEALATVGSALGLQGPQTHESVAAAAQKYHITGTTLRNNGHTPTHDDIVAAMHADGQGGEGFISKNKVPLAVGGLGLGAMYMMHKKHQEEQDRVQGQNRVLRAAAMPAA